MRVCSVAEVFAHPDVYKEGQRRRGGRLLRQYLNNLPRDLTTAEVVNSCRQELLDVGHRDIVQQFGNAGR